MIAKLITGTCIVMAAVAFVAITLYDVRLNFVFLMPGESSQPDPAQEALYQLCFDAQDEQIHDSAFRTIDNPDVQKEFINTSRVRATIECRDEFPRQWVTTRQPFRLNLFDMHPRYW